MTDEPAVRPFRPSALKPGSCHVLDETLEMVFGGAQVRSADRDGELAPPRPGRISTRAGRMTFHRSNEAAEATGR